MVSSHNDLKPENVLYDGQRVWMVDWEAAFLNDRYLDLAVVANFIVTKEGDERAYLREYFGHDANDYQLARFFLMQQILHMAYAAMFLFLGSGGQPLNEATDEPDFRDFHDRMWAGEINLKHNDMKVAYGRVHWNQLVHNLSTSRLQEALSIIRDQHAGIVLPVRDSARA
jgi:hypothetical protein